MVVDRNRHPLCIGLDPDLAKIPTHLQTGDTTNPDVALHFCTNIVDATAGEHPGWYKANLGFFLRLGGRGLDSLCRLREHVSMVAPTVGFILDSKSCDIGDSMAQYVAMAFDLVGADGMTANPYPGQDACQPLLDRKDKLGIYLCRTSNKGSGEFQCLTVRIPEDEREYLSSVGAVPWSAGMSGSTTTFSNHVAYRVSRHWNQYGNCGLVVGATYAEELRFIRLIAGGQVSILAPGIGKQGGDLATTVKNGLNQERQGLMINVGSSILYASSGTDCFEAAAAGAKRYHQEIDQLMTA